MAEKASEETEAMRENLTSSDEDDSSVVLVADETKEQSPQISQISTTESSSTPSSEGEKDISNDNAALLAKIAKLEAENKELLKERESFKNSIVINTNDVYANLQQLQTNLAAKAAKSFEAVRSAVPDSGNIGFDLTP